ncbi:cold shock and DUF1294 domain-containing protein [Halotia branconii]|uniref:Cold shock and DUF1294 domain-containing protein n=1 Tax=Halotia branconii CENA392 TaxID=1539056 RepID=A0AAJ6NVG4_9CYAN|nr:cold shock and DUF1294 domain-containing protein [Halotia branconii]WGV27246.1 cold shock and DUF1294 domain-containing protein [Halotia branconii CENA392]
MKPVLHKGQLTKWKDDRGFGFIQPANGSQEVFVHITAFKHLNRRPQVGDFIYYQLTVDKDGKARACNASMEKIISKPILQPSSSTTPIEFKYKPIAKFSSLVLETFFLSLLPGLGSIHFAITVSNPIPLILYPVMSLITFALYASDKSRAKQKRWRVSEKTLHLCEFIGGWLGAFVAQRKLHHKSSKVSYQVVFWMIVILHIVFWLVWLLFSRALINLFQLS